MDNSPMWDNALSRVTLSNTNFERKDTQIVPFEQRPQQWDYERYISIVERLKFVSYDSLMYDKVSEMTIIDAAVNAVLLAGNNSLLNLVKDFGTGQQEEKLMRWQNETHKDMSMLWNEEMGIYVDFDVISSQQINEVISGAFMLLFAGVKGGNEALYRKKLQRWISQDMPSTDIESDKFEALRYWRGPSWSIVNFIVYCGCLLVDWQEEAKEIRDRSFQQIITGGFYENFNPINRKGAGAAYFSWTAATSLYWLDDINSSFNFKEIF